MSAVNYYMLDSSSLIKKNIRMQILFGVFDGIAHHFPSKGKKKMRLMARNSFVSNTKKTGCITAAGPQKIREL
jgi:hypothetical protein